MSHERNPDENESETRTEKVTEVHHMEEDVDTAGLPDADFLGLDPGDANKETPPGAPRVPDRG